MSVPYPNYNNGFGGKSSKPPNSHPQGTQRHQQYAGLVRPPVTYNPAAQNQQRQEVAPRGPLSAARLPVGGYQSQPLQPPFPPPSRGGPISPPSSATGMVTPPSTYLGTQRQPQTGLMTAHPSQPVKNSAPPQGAPLSSFAGPMKPSLPTMSKPQLASGPPGRGPIPPLPASPGVNGAFARPEVVPPRAPGSASNGAFPGPRIPAAPRPFSPSKTSSMPPPTTSSFNAMPRGPNSGGYSGYPSPQRGLASAPQPSQAPKARIDSAQIPRPLEPWGDESFVEYRTRSKMEGSHVRVHAYSVRCLKVCIA